MPGRKQHTRRSTTKLTEATDSPTFDPSIGTESEAERSYETSNNLTPVPSIDGYDDYQGQLSQSTIGNLSAEPESQSVNYLSGELSLARLNHTASERGSLPRDDGSYLQECKDMHDELFPNQKQQKNEMGTWELDLLHQEHECYNIYLFNTLRPSAEHERQYPSQIFGYGQVSIRVLDDKDSTQWNELVLEDVKYVVPARDINPNTATHRVGRWALPEGTHLHLPKGRQGQCGDGFLSIADDDGCALGRLNQGGRQIWALRTYNEPFKFTGFLSAFTGEPRASENKNGKRVLMIEDSEVC